MKFDVYVLYQAKELIASGAIAGETRELEIDLPPFLRKSSSFARNRVTSRLNGL